MESSVNNTFSQGTLFMFLPDKADDHLAGPEEEGEHVKKDVTKVTVQCTVVRWDGIDKHYIVKCEECNINNTSDSKNEHELIDNVLEGAMNHLGNKVLRNVDYLAPSWCYQAMFYL